MTRAVPCAEKTHRPAFSPPSSKHCIGIIPKLWFRFSQSARPPDTADREYNLQTAPTPPAAEIEKFVLIGGKRAIFGYIIFWPTYEINFHPFFGHFYFLGWIELCTFSGKSIHSVNWFIAFVIHEHYFSSLPISDAADNRL